MSRSVNRLIRIFGTVFTLLAVLNLVFTILKENFPEVKIVMSGARIFCRDISFYLFYVIFGFLIILAKEVDELKKKTKDDNK